MDDIYNCNDVWCMDECDEDDGGEREKKKAVWHDGKAEMGYCKKAKGPPSPPLWNYGLPKKKVTGKENHSFFFSSYFHRPGLNHGHERRPHANYLLSHESWTSLSF